MFPFFVDYPEEKFGGFLATHRLPRPGHQKEIDEHGWAVWPPIHFTYNTVQLNLPVPAPAPPTWRLTDEQCRAIAERAAAESGRPLGCRDIEWNWLGTDDPGATWSRGSSTASACRCCSA